MVAGMIKSATALELHYCLSDLNIAASATHPREKALQSVELAMYTVAEGLGYLGAIAEHLFQMRLNI